MPCDAPDYLCLLTVNRSLVFVPVFVPVSYYVLYCVSGLLHFMEWFLLTARISAVGVEGRVEGVEVSFV